MTVRLTEEKIQSLMLEISSVLETEALTIQEVAHIVGKLVATFPGVAHAKLYYRQIDNEKIEALKTHKGDYKRKMKLSQLAKDDLQWWLDNLLHSYASVEIKNPTMELYADASDIGWGGTVNDKNTGGQWKREELQSHINVREILAVLYSLQSLCSNEKEIVIKIISDNTTCVNYINKQGGKKHKCYKATRYIWEWAIKRNIWLIAVHLPGSQNIQADKLSRMYHANTEWVLRKDLFEKIKSRFGPLDFDLFASRLNNQLPDYASWKPDPGAKLCDAMSFSWKAIKGYAFPPFALIGKVLKKVEFDKTTIVIVVPEWPSQYWYPKLMSMLVDYPLFIPPRDKGRITNQQPEQPITANLIVCKISGLGDDIKAFLMKHTSLLERAGEIQQDNNMQSIYPNLKTFVVHGIPIPCRRI